MGLGALGREQGSDHGASCLQSHRKASNRRRQVDQGRAAKPMWAHTEPKPTQDRGDNLHLMKGLSCHCLMRDNEVLLTQNIRGSPGKIAVLQAIHLQAQARFASKKSP